MQWRISANLSANFKIKILQKLKPHSGGTFVANAKHWQLMFPKTEGMPIGDRQVTLEGIAEE